ncbi:MAG TPA: hypothetical protein ENN22_06655, partial [bacterium]|nr:hypothetical protein [bacterium]
FMYIREFQHLPINLTVNVPYNWKLATNLPFDSEDFQYRAQNYLELIQNPLFMGPFEEIYFDHQGQLHYIIFNGIYKSNMEKLSLTSQKLLAYQTDLFSISFSGRYLFIFEYLLEQRGPAGQGFPNYAVVYLSSRNIQNDFKNIEKTIGSSFVQSWFNPLFYRGIAEKIYEPQIQTLWFWKGLAEYYGMLSAVRAGSWSEEDFVSHLISEINRYLRFEKFYKLPVARISYDIQKQDVNEALEYLKLKGELLCFLLDVKIRSISQNTRSFDNIAKFIRDWCVDYQGNFSDDDILKIINSLSSINFTTFFDMYVFGKMMLPINETLEQAGIYAELLVDTIPDLDHTILTKNQVINNLPSEHPFAIGGIKNGDKIVAMNNVRITDRFDFRKFIESQSVSSEIEVMVERDKLSVLHLIKIPGKEIPILKLINAIPRTETQLKLRKGLLSGK